MSKDAGTLDALLTEDRRFSPSEDFRTRAVVSDADIYERANTDRESYWVEWAEQLDWFRRWDSVLEWQPPHAKWFVGGKLNVAYNCLDRHLNSSRSDQAALIWEGEPGDTRTYTYAQLHDAVCRFSNALKNLGVTRGDRVTIYLPMIPEAAIAMLACVRIGAIHSVVSGALAPNHWLTGIMMLKLKCLSPLMGAGEGVALFLSNLMQMKLS